MRIGYSFWGFLGPGITDTPDGGRSHRRTLIDGLIAAGHDIVFLQANRDLDEAGDDLADRYPGTTGCPTSTRCSSSGAGRSPAATPPTAATPATPATCTARTSCSTTTPSSTGMPTILWDKDRQLPRDSPLRQMPNVTVCEAALHPSPARSACCSPSPTRTSTRADPVSAGRHAPADCRWSTSATSTTATRRSSALLRAGRRPLRAPGRRQMDATPRAGRTSTSPAAALPRTSESCTQQRWPRCCCCPDRYARAGQMTQRLFEAVLAGCLPLTPGHDPRAPPSSRPRHCIAADRTAGGRPHRAGCCDIAGTARHAELIAACLDRLDVFRLSRQLDTLDQILGRLTDDLSACPRPSAPLPLASWPMDRIAIIGCGGSGKSTLARQLADMLGSRRCAPRRPVLRRGLEPAADRRSSPPCSRNSSPRRGGSSRATTPPPCRSGSPPPTP